MCLFLFSVTLLQVTGITFSNIETTSYRVQWTPPNGYTSSVSGYTVGWSPSASGSLVDIGTTTFTDITGLTPGWKYTVTITTRHVSAAGVTKTTFVNKEQSTSKFSFHLDSDIYYPVF